ncbi:MAG: outer membrane lipoprotein carrier protein LolA [Saprospiraceae bacterium]|nr:outer membrane lipoprotein carrier protein LolA [Saprospiraceae bacterium]
MRQRCITILVFLLSATLAAQEGQFLSTTESDPAATALLDRMEQYLSAYDAAHVTFSMSIDHPGQERIIYEGTVDQQGARFRIDVGTYLICSDGVTRWVFVEEINEVSIYNADPEDGPQTPLDHLRLYQTEAFIYAITGEDTVDGEQAQVIEFKPVDKYSDFSKVRLTVRGRDARPLSMHVFDKGGSRIHLQIHQISAARPFPDNHFRFVIADHPGVRVEDLRID